MSTALAVIHSRDILTPEDLEVLKNSKFKGFTDHEVAYCARISNALALSPLLNQIHFVRRKNKDGTYSITAQVGIDGFRLQAQRAGGYAGSDEPIYETAPGKRQPVKATVTVYRIVEGQKCSFTASARWDEYNAGQGMWDKMPFNQLSKCAEALALRKAFPAELSGLRTDEEMEQADKPNKAQTVQAQIAPKQEQAIEAESRPVEAAEAAVSGCPSCGSSNVMVSRYRENTMYCRACKTEYPKEG